MTADAVGKLFVNKAQGRINSVYHTYGVSKMITDLLLDEASLNMRRRKTRGIATLHQLNGIHMWTNEETIIPEPPRIHYSGTHMRDVLGPVSYDRWENSWKLPIDMKRKMDGAMRRPVGGRTDGFGVDAYDNENMSDGPGAEPEAPIVFPGAQQVGMRTCFFGGHFR